METEILENPTIDDIKFAVSSMWERNYILYKQVRVDDLVILYFKTDSEA